MYVKIGEASKKLGISIKILRKWAEKGKIEYIKTPGGHRFIDISSIKDSREDQREKIIYCRVSSKKQREDLERQLDKAKELYPEHKQIKDIGSGLNFKRPGFVSLLDRVMCGEIKEIVVFHRDRLCRFGFELFEYICKRFKTQIIVHYREEGQSPEQELCQDLMSIVHVFSCRQMGARRYQRIKENKNNSYHGSTASSENMDGRCQNELQSDSGSIEESEDEIRQISDEEYCSDKEE